MDIVFDDIIYSIQKAGGVSEVWSQITLNPPYDTFHITYTDAEKNISYKRYKNHRYIMCSNHFIFIKRYLNLNIKSREKYIFHSSYFRASKNKMALNVTTVHDFIYEYYYRNVKALPHKWQKRYAVMNSDAVICVSENTKKDLKKFYPDYKGLIKVIHNGYKEDVYQYRGNLEREKIILYVGSRAFYKRFDLAIELMKMVKGYQFVIVGGGDLTNVEKNMLKSLPKGSYKKEGYLTDDELSELYNKAYFLCYPSEYEGFGIPPVEAQACGCIPICQKKSSLVEVLNGTGIELDTDHLENTAQKIFQCLDMNVLEKLQKEGRENAKRFSWDKCRIETYNLYDELWARRVGDN